MYADPPAPQPMRPGETPPAKPGANPLDPQPRAWEFNPEYQRLVTAWQTVLPLLESITTALDKAYRQARSPQTWEAPVGERYVEDLAAWRSRLALYRQAVLTAISDEAADTPRWIPSTAGAPRAFP
ncbi:hypothetical protein [Nonomuraea indica]|uniref:PPE domain-containing protein n=1 Tax=Nonomuraea indica TaxID=1581193 RepID=A0ABW8AFD7_9ACTN|nr:hypothetical protein [Nonomuraea indica]